MRNFSIYSQYTYKTYDIKVYIPDTQPPAEGFPVYYVLDGLSYFSIVGDVIKIQQQNYKKTFVKPAIVVGICHQKRDMREHRFIDFTAPAKSLLVPPHTKGKVPEAYGGAEKFLHFIEHELKPSIEGHHPVNLSKQAIFGHSLGGYFALWCLFTKPAAFSSYMAVSPSVWWNGEELLELGQIFITASEYDDNTRVFIAVGEHEGFMVDGAQKVASLLEPYLLVEHFVAPDENHASVVPTVMSRAIRFCSRN